jgi:hypothetical protein
MADTQSAIYKMQLDIEETKDLGLDLVTNPTITHTGDTPSGTLTADTTVPVTKTYSDTLLLSGGTAKIDLTSLPGPLSTTITFAGLKVQLCKIACPSTNTGGITFDVGTNNGANLFGADNASDESIEVMPGATHQFYVPDKLENVDATHCEIDVTGTGTESFNIILGAG